jgi:outer membrane protein TolC
MKIKIPIFLILCFALPNVCYAKQQNNQLTALIGQALENNPELKNYQKKWQAAKYKVKFLKGLPNPVFQYGYFFENVETRVGPQEQKFAIFQKIPFPGKLGMQGEIQRQVANILKEKYEQAKWRLVTNIKFVYYDIFYIDRAIETVKEEESILESIERVARRKYESGFVSQQNVIKAQLELSAIISRLLELKQNRQILVSKLNSLISVDIKKEIETIGKIEITNFNHELDALKKAALASSRDITSAKFEIDKSEKRIKLAKKNYLPDFTLGIDYIQTGKGQSNASDKGKDAVIGILKLELPLWFGKIKADINEKNALHESARKNLELSKDKKIFEIEDIYFKITTQKDIILLYETALMPQAEQSFKSTDVGYQSGKMTFLDWLDAQRMMLKTKLAYYKTLSDYEKLISQMENAMTTNLNEIPEKKNEK